MKTLIGTAILLAPIQLVFGCAGDDDRRTDTTAEAEADASAETEADGDTGPTLDAEGTTDGATDVTTEVSPDDTPDTIGADTPDTVAQPGVLEASTFSLDFGSWECGSTLPLKKTVKLKNTGGVKATYAATIAGSYQDSYTLIDRGPGTIAPGAEVDLVVGVRIGAASAPGDKPAQLLLSVVDGATFVGNVQLSWRVDGAVLRTELSNADFGEVAVGGSQTFISEVRNAGTRTASLAVDTELDPEFAVTFPGAPGPLTLAPGATVALSAVFMPTGAERSEGNAVFTATGPICDQRELTPIPMYGHGSTGSIRVSGDIDFGDIECGAAPEAKPVTIANDGGAPLGYTAVVHPAGAFTVDPPDGALGAHSVATLWVSPAATDLTGSPLEGYIAITTDVAGDNPHEVRVRQNVVGAVVRFADASLTLETSPGTQVTSEVRLTNSGTVGAVLTLASASPKLTLGASSVAIPPGQTISVPVSYSASMVDATSVTSIYVEGPVTGGCGDTPTPLPVFLRPLGAGLGVDVLGVDFGATKCGETPASQFVFVRNASLDETLPITAEIVGAEASHFELRHEGAPVSGPISVPPGGALLEVTAEGAAARDTPRVISALLVITYDRRLLRQVALGHRISGAIIVWDTPAVALGDVPAGADVTFPVRLLNLGNTIATLLVESTTGESRVVTVQADSDGHGVSETFTQTLGDMAPGAFTGSLSLSEWGSGASTLCADLPEPLAITATGVTGALEIEETSLELGDIFCGASATPAAAVHVSNSGLAPIAITAALADGARFLVDPASATLEPGAAFTFEVRARPVATGSPGDAVDMLTLTSDIPADDPHLVRVHALVRGARVTLPARVTVPTTAVGTFRPPVPIGIVVEGNAPVTLLFNDEGEDTADELSYTAPTSGGMLGFSLRSYGVAFLPTTPGMRSIRVKVSATASSPLCQPIDPDLIRIDVSASGPVLDVSPTALDVGYAGCGETALATSFTLTNLTTAAQPFSIASDLGAASAYEISPAAGSVPASGEAVITVTPKPVRTDYRPTELTERVFVVDLSERLVVSAGSTTAVVDVSQLGYGGAWVFHATEPRVMNYPFDGGPWYVEVHGVLTSTRHYSTLARRDVLDYGLTLTRTGACHEWAGCVPVVSDCYVESLLHCIATTEGTATLGVESTGGDYPRCMEPAPVVQELHGPWP